jgi:flagellar hook-associated protein 2
MSTTSIDGLISGLDTTTIITQLMQLAAQPQTALKNRVTSEQTRVSSLQTVNAQLAAVATKAADLSQLSSWTPNTATSDYDGVTVQADPSAAVGSVGFTIDSLATSYQAVFNTSGTPQTSVMAANVDYTITFDDGHVTHVNTGDGSLQQIADNLNASGTDVHAVLVQSGTDASNNPVYSLQVTSAQTGTSSGFAITETTPGATGAVAFVGGVKTSTAGTDASITMDGQVTPLTSHTNTFTDLMPGVDVTLGPDATVNDHATITVARDAGGLSDKVQALVDAANAALDGISSLTGYDSSSQTAGLLAGDPALRAASDEVLSAVTDGVNGKSLASVGIEVDKTGKITFDADTFKQAYEADPAGTAAMFAGTATWNGTGTPVTLVGSTWRTQPGFHSVVASGTGGTIDNVTATQTGDLLTGATNSPAEGLTLSYTGSVNGTIDYVQGIAAKLETVAQRASNSTDGSVTMEIQGRNTSIDGMQDDIASWDIRLQEQKQTLEQQYANLEVALGKLKSQGTWLAGQIASLPSIDTGSSSGN